jgi:hypothetical protein
MKSKFIPFNNRYPLNTDDELEDLELEFTSTEYRKAEIDEIGTLRMHRLLRTNYGVPKIQSPAEPLEFDDAGIPYGDEWAYIFDGSESAKILIRTIGHHTELEVMITVIPGDKDLKQSETLERFIDDLISESERQQRNINEFDLDNYASTGLKIYSIENIYLVNYSSAEFLMERATTIEAEVQEEGLKYDARDPEVHNDEAKMDHIEKYMMIAGSIPSSAIFYYFMALEGFINLIYFGFLNPEHSHQQIQLERRLDIEMKFNLLPSLCSGFNESPFANDDALLKRFREIKTYRNNQFHSGLKSMVKHVSVMEDNFSYNIARPIKSTFPQEKIKLEDHHVIYVRDTVKRIIDKVLKSASEQNLEVIEKFLMKTSQVPFCQDTNGTVRLGGAYQDIDSE